MRSRLFPMLPVALTAGLLAAASLVSSVGATPNMRTYDARLTGAAEVPGPGDPNAAGHAWITLSEEQRKICWVIEAENLGSAPVAAHIHLGSEDVAGPVLVPLSPPVAGSSEGCVDGIDATLIRAIQNNPSNYYVNVHTTALPAGAIRGQLNFGSTP